MCSVSCKCDICCIKQHYNLLVVQYVPSQSHRGTTNFVLAINVYNIIKANRANMCKDRKVNVFINEHFMVLVDCSVCSQV